MSLDSFKTQLESAKVGEITDEMRAVAIEEDINVEFLRDEIAAGRISIMKNRLHDIKPVAIGTDLRVKTNANIGTSQQYNKPEIELEKLKIAEDAGADVIMDLSTGGDLDGNRKAIMAASNIPVGTVPIYQAMVEAFKREGDMLKVDKNLMFEIVRKHCEDGVDFLTIHCGVTKEVVKQLDLQGRLTGVVSRGGSFLVKWIKETGLENPFYEHYDELIDICREYDVVMSLGDGLRPGALADATDRAQIQELIILGELCQRANAKGVSVMVEGPGHVPINEIKTNMELQKKLCNGAPFYVLGPLVTDVAPGYDHITAAIGGAWAAYFGADFLCYVTPSEHLGLPSVDDVKDGVMVSRIAAHAADVARNPQKFRKWDDAMSKARKDLDWEEQMKLAIDPEKARHIRSTKNIDDPETCSMCGEFCSMK